MTDQLPLAQRMVLTAVMASPGLTASALRDAMNLPRTTAALKNVQAALTALVAAGYIGREIPVASTSRTAGGAARYTVSA